MFGWSEKRNRGVRRMAELSGALDGACLTGPAGLMASSRVASNLGWRAVDALTVGDKVLTFDHGMQPIHRIETDRLDLHRPDVPVTHLPVLIPLGVLFNRIDIWMMPDQGLLIETEAALDALGDPFAVVPARALVGLGGIRHARPGDAMRVITLSCEQDAVVYVEGGMLAHCPRARGLLGDEPRLSDALYDVLPLRDARRVAECLAAERPGEFGHDPADIARYA